METKIKPFQEIVMIKLKDWRILRTMATMEQVSRILNDKSKDYITIDWVGFNRLTGVENYFPYIPDEMESFILWQPKDVQEKLEKIIKDRQSKWFETRGTKHLRQIYLDNYWKNE